MGRSNKAIAPGDKILAHGILGDRVQENDTGIWLLIAAIVVVSIVVRAFI